MMQFEYDPERLIEEVKKRPGIWNYDDPSYRSMVRRIELWKEVVAELLQPDIKVTKSENRELVLQLQKKWKSIKDSFTKYMQNPNRTKRPYIYCKQLQFLMKNNEEVEVHQGGEGGSDSDDAPLKKKPVWDKRKRKSINLTKQEETSEEDDNYADTTETFSNDDGESSAKMPRTMQTVDEFAFASVDSIKNLEGEDPDKMFLLSLLPHLKSIPEEMRLNVKMDLLNVLRNANEYNVNCN